MVDRNSETLKDDSNTEKIIYLSKEITSLRLQADPIDFFFNGGLFNE